MGGDPKQVKAVIQSIKQYANFRQMAGYNISCLMTYITPPTVGWRENVAAAVEDNGIESIISVLAKHGESLDMIKQATSALSGMAISKANAGRVAANGGIETAVKCMLGKNVQKDPEVVASGCKLMETVARYNPESIVKAPNAIKSMLKGINHSEVPRVQAASAKVLDRVGGMGDDGLKAIVQSGGIKAIVSSMMPDKPTHEAMLRPLFRLLEKLAKNEDYVKQIRENGGVEALVAQLEKHSDNEYILRAGGRLLAKIADADIEQAISSLLNGKNLSPSVQQHLVGLIANLALQPDNIDKIVKNRGIEALLKNFDDFNPQTKAAALRALQRIAQSDKDNAELIIKNGGLEKIIETLKNANGDEELLVASTAALTALVQNGCAKEVCDAGGLEAVTQQMAANPSKAAFLASAMEFLEALGSADGIDAILNAMKQQLKNELVIVKGFKALCSILMKENDQGAVAKRIVTHEHGAVLTQSMIEHRMAVTSVSTHSIKCVALLSITEESIEKLRELGILRALLESVYCILNLDMMSIDDTDVELERDLLKDVQTVIAAVVEPKRVSSLPLSKGKASEDVLKQVMMFCLVNDFSTELLVKKKQKVAEFLGLCLVSQDVSVVSTCVWTLSKFAPESGKNKKFMKDFVSTAGSKTVLQMTRKETEPEKKLALLHSLTYFLPSCVQTLVFEHSLIEACVAAMRSSADSHLVAQICCKLLAKASASAVPKEVLQRGAVKQVNKMITDYHTSKEFEWATLFGFQMLYSIASLKDGEMNSQLSSLGTVNCVTQAMSSFTENGEILDLGAKILSLLMTEQDVIDLIAQIRALVQKLSPKSRSLDRVLVPLGQKIATLGYLTSSDNFKDLLKQEGANELVKEALMKSLAAEKEPTLARQACNRNIYRTWGLVTANVDNYDEKNVVATLHDHLQQPLTSIGLTEKTGILEALVSLGSSAAAESNAAELIKTITELLNENRSDDLFAQTAMAALTALMGVEAATKVKSGELVFSILRDEMEHISPKTCIEGLKMLTKYCSSKENADALIEDGIVDMVSHALDAHAEKATANASDEDVFEHGVSLLHTLAYQSVPAKEEMVQKQQCVLKKVLTKNDLVEVKTSGHLALFNLLREVTDEKELCPKVRDMNAVPLVMDIMERHPGDALIEEAGQRILKNLIGQDASALEQSLKDYDALLREAVDDMTPEALTALHRAQENLRNMLLMKDLVDVKGASLIMERALTTYEEVNVERKKVDNNSPHAFKVIGTALDTIGKVTLVDGALKTVDMERVLGDLESALKSDEGLDEESKMKALTSLNALVLEETDGKKTVLPSSLLMQLEEMGKASSSEPQRVKDMANMILRNYRPVFDFNTSQDDEILKALLLSADRDSDTNEELESFLKSLLEKDNDGEMMAKLMKLALDMKNDPNATEEEKILAHNMITALGNLAASDDDHKLNFILPPSLLQQMMDDLSLKDNQDRKGLLQVLGGMTVDDDTIDFINKNALLQSLLNDGELETLEALLRKDERLREEFLKIQGTRQLVEYMKENEQDAVIQAKGLDILAMFSPKELLLNGGIDNQETLAYLQKVMNAENQGQRKRDHAKLLEDLQNLYDSQNKDMEPMLLGRFDNMLQALEKAKDWKSYFDQETGRYYYHNKVSGETVWKKPFELKSAENALVDLEKLLNRDEDHKVEVDAFKLQQAIQFLNTSNNAGGDKKKDLANALAALAKNEKNREAMVKHGVLEALVKALSSKKEFDRDFILAAVALLNQFSKHPVYKEMICKIGGIIVLIKIMLRFLKDEEIVEKCAQCLGNLAFESDLCSEEIVTQKGVEAVGHVLKQHKDSLIVNLNTMSLLNNLMYKSMERKQKVGDLLRDRIVAVLRRLYKDLKVFKQTARVIGNIAFIDDHIRRVVSLSAVKSVVVGMDLHESDLEATKLGVKVISNFAAVNEDEFEQEIRVGKLVSVISTIWHEGGAKKVMDLLSSTSKKDDDLTGSCIQTLRHLLEDPDVRKKLIGMQVVQILFQICATANKEVSSFCIDSFELLSYSAEGVASLYENDGVSVLLQLLDDVQMQEDVEVCTVITQTLINMCSNTITSNDQSQRTLADIFQQRGVQTLLASMEQNVTDDKFVPLVMRLLTLLTAFRDDVSQNIAQQGMRIILQAVTKHEDNPLVLQHAYQLLGLLAFENSNLKVIVQYGGINLIVKSILKFPENDALVKRSIKTLDNIAMASQEHSNIVSQARGKDVINELLKTYETIPGDKAVQVVKACKAALISLNKIETRKKERKLFFTENREEVDPMNDPLKVHRELLRTGAEVTFWNGGRQTVVHLLVNPDSFQIGWKVSGGRKMLGKCELKNFVGVTKGLMPGHGKGVSPKCAFALTSTEKKRAFCFEAAHEVDRNRWFEALDALKQVHRSQNTKFLHL